jgi:DNA-binding transcriptional LysR family regulator
MALISALIGLTFQIHKWQIAALAVVVTLLIAFIDCYHSWLYAQLLRHAISVEQVLGLYYVALARGEEDPQAQEDFEVALLAHSFGRFSGIRAFRLRDLRNTRPRVVIRVLYSTLLIAAIVAGGITVVTKRTAEKRFECSSVPGAQAVYVCKEK